jgi:uncharacterized phage infection (PIP) family protein YhgE
VRRFALLVAVFALVALGASAGACGDGGGGSPTALEEYFNEVEDSAGTLDERTAAVAATLETSDDLDDLKNAAGQYPDILSDFLEDLQALPPANEAAALQQDAIDSGQAFLDLLSDAVDEAEQVETEAEFVAALASDEVENASDEFTRTCLALQALAGDNDIDVDLGCGA